MIDLACRLKPKDKIIGVSDAVQSAGLPAGGEGIYHLGASEIKVKDGLATTGEGIIAGTTMTLETGWRHMANFARMPATTAAACFTSNPANDLGLITRGELKPGKRADISFFECGSNRPVMTVIKGHIRFSASPASSSGVA